MDIEYANPAYSLALAGGRQLTEMKGRRLSDFVAREDADAIETNIRLALKSERPTESIEAINSDVSDEVGRIKRIYRALRFSFATTTEHRLLGDFTFDWSQIVDGELRKCQTDLHDRIEGEYFATQATAKQFVFDALEQAPLAIAIKRADSKICIACNDTYVELANVHRQKRGKLTREQICGNGDTSGMTMQEIFGLEGDHPSVVKEHQLVIERKWVYDTTSLKPTARKRTSLRFPMFGPQGNVELIGVISANFKLEAYRAGMSWEIQAQ
jgi:hypothetical protein